MNNESQQKEFTVGHGLGIFVLLLMAVVFVSVISYVVFGVHLTLILSELVVLLVPLCFLSTGGYSLRSFLTYRGKLNFSFWILTGVTSVFLFVVSNDITGYIHQLMPRPQAQKETLLKIFVAKSWSEYFFRILGASSLAGFCEELAFRGFLQSIFSRRSGKIKGFLLTLFLFAFLHLDPWNFAGVFLLGLFFGYLVYPTNNLWVAILVHFFIDSIAFSMGFFLPQIWSDFEFTCPPYITLICTILFIISLNLIRKVYTELQSQNVC